MQINERLREGHFLKRYKRFFADIEIEGQVLVAHLPNTGSLKTCLYDNCPCVITETDNPNRKLKATLHFLKTPSGWVGVNTSLTNQLVYEAWEQAELWPELRAAKREYKINAETRLDLVLARDAQALAEKRGLHFVEIKNVTLAEGRVARFPDAATTRGQKHLMELTTLVQQGHTAEILYVVQREDCQSFSPAQDIDPEYARLLREAKRAGVKVSAYACALRPEQGQVRLMAQPLTIALLG